MAKIEKIGNIQIVDNKEDKFFYFPMILWLVPGLGTEAEKVEKLSPLFFSTPRNLLIWDQVEMLCSCY